MCPARTGLVPRDHHAVGWLRARHKQGGLKLSPAELTSLQDRTTAGLLPGQGAPRNAGSSLSPKAKPQDAALNPHPTLPALPPPSLGRAHSAARFDHSWCGRVFLLGSTWTAKELLEKSLGG